MSQEVEVNAAGTGARYKFVAKPPLILKPCEHLVKEIGKVRKKLIIIHGNADGSIRVTKKKV